MSRWAGNILTAAGSLVVTLGLLEGACRLAGYGNWIRYRPHPVLLWELIPDQEGVDKGTGDPVHINAQGLRDDEDIPRHKGRNVIRLLCLGDSCTFGWGVPFGQTFAQRLEALLNAEAIRGAHYDVLNAGVNAYSVHQERLLLGVKGDSLQPDLVIASFTFNDRWQNFSLGQSPEERARILRGVTVKNLLRRSALYNFLFEVQLRRLYYAGRKELFTEEEDVAGVEGGAPEGTGMQGRGARGARAYADDLRGIVEWGRARGIPTVFLLLPSRAQMTQPRGRGWHLQRIMEEVGRWEGVPVVDVREEFRRAGGEALFVGRDAVHPNGQGHAIIARALHRAVKGMALP